jgi:hypothetical protein
MEIKSVNSTDYYSELTTVSQLRKIRKKVKEIDMTVSTYKSKIRNLDSNKDNINSLPILQNKSLEWKRKRVDSQFSMKISE